MRTKKFLTAAAVISLTAAMVLGLAGCGGPKTSTEFLNGTTLNGQDLSLLTPADAADYLNQSLSEYELKVNLTSGDSVAETLTVTGADLKLEVSPDVDLQALLDEQNADNTKLEFTTDELFTYDLSNLQNTLEAENTRLHEESDQRIAELKAAAQAEEEAAAEAENLSAEQAGAEGEAEEAAAEEPAAEPEIADPYGPIDAKLVFNSDTLSFEVAPASYGRYRNVAMILSAVQTAVEELAPSVELTPDQYSDAPQIKEDDTQLQAALAEAQAYMDLDLTYTFTPDGGSTSEYHIDRATLANLFSLGEDGRTIVVDEEVLGSFVTELCEKYQGEKSSTQFKTTGGSYININVTSAGQSVDSTAFYTDLLDKLSNKTSGTFVAPYAKKDDNAAGFWGGNYVEIDLTNQHLWCYRNNQVVVSCSIVSGCVVNKTTTPTGCFTIFSKDYDRYLKGNNVDGTTYNTHVQYFMPFSGGCGIHDATWRSNFGGEIYVYSGSHGCVGVTLGNAKTIYNNVEVGTHVVVYGGKTSADPLAQSLSVSGPASMTVGEGGSLSVGGASTGLTFSSSDPNVVAVDANGNLVAVGVGTVTITINAAGSSKYQAATTTITITVGEAPPAECPHDWVAQTEEQTVVDQEAYDEEVVDSEAWDEEVVVSEAYDEYVCSICGESLGAADDIHEDDQGAASTIHHDAVTDTVHHDAVSHTVHHDAVTHTETVTVGYACSLCGETKSA